MSLMDDSQVTMDPKDMIQSNSTSYSPSGTPCPSDMSQFDHSSPATTMSSSSSSSLKTNKKKRKSWGQVLPVPTTNLPPRKRAKTEEEKAQRLYERVQRNRQAAHNSRMRKQDEMDTILTENEQLKAKNQWLQAQVDKLKEENARLANSHGYQSAMLHLLPPTPPLEALQSEEFIPAPPSLTETSSPDDNALPPSPQFLSSPDMDGKLVNGTHSAVMCNTPLWTLTKQASIPSPERPGRRNKT